MSVTLFEEITIDLTEDELKFVEDIQIAFESVLVNGKKMKSVDLEFFCNQYLHDNFIGYQLNGTKIRKFCNYLRSNGLLPILATSSGYYISTDKSEIELQIKSLKERANSILTAAKGLEIFLR